MILAMFNDNTGVTGYRFELTALWNTIVARTPTNPVVVSVGNTTLDAAAVTFSNNILAGTSAIVGVSDTGVANTTVSGTHNFLQSGATAGDLTASVTGADPGFRDAGNLDFTLGSGSACIGGADTTVAGAPDKEYFQNETVRERYRLRLSVADIGAFEHDTAGGSYGIREAPEGGTGGSGGSVVIGDSGAGGAPGSGGRGGGTVNTGGTAGSTAGGDAGPSAQSAPASEEGGCGCRHAGSGATKPLLLVIGVAALIARRTRRAPARGTPCRAPCRATGSFPPSIRSTR
jgi:MYXO-CTERM domain-containing protein